jgi:hypothetical protein
MLNKNLYLIACLYNFAVGAISLAAFYFNPNLVFFTFDNFTPENALAATFMFTMSGNIMLFGAGYFMIYRNQIKNRGMILFGILGKLGIIIFIPTLYFLGKASILSLCLSGVDVLFSCLFLIDWMGINQAQDFA